MRVITIVSLGASAVLGLAALFVAKTVLPNTAAARQAAQAGAQGAGVPVVVAAHEIKYGDKLEPGMLAVVNVPQAVAPQGAFTNIKQVLSQDHGGPPVALTPMAVHEAVLPAKLSGPGARPSVAAEIAQGLRAYTIRVTDVSGVGGQALPGDHVDVVLMRDLTPQGQVRHYVSYVVLQNVRLLSVDLNADLSSNKPAEPKNATLEVSVEDAQKLAIASTLGTLSLALRRTGEADLEDARMLDTGDFLAGGGGAVAPGGGGGGHGVVRRHAAGRGGAGLITIIEYGGRSGSAPRTAAPLPPMNVTVTNKTEAANTAAGASAGA
jgi:pilus assembly protein CpaB